MTLETIKRIISNLPEGSKYSIHSNGGHDGYSVSFDHITNEITSVTLTKKSLMFCGLPKHGEITYEKYGDWYGRSSHRLFIGREVLRLNGYDLNQTYNLEFVYMAYNFFSQSDKFESDLTIKYKGIDQSANPEFEYIGLPDNFTRLNINE